MKNDGTFAVRVPGTDGWTVNVYNCATSNWQVYTGLTLAEANSLMIEIRSGK